MPPKSIEWSKRGGEGGGAGGVGERRRCCRRHCRRLIINWLIGIGLLDNRIIDNKMLIGRCTRGEKEALREALQRPSEMWKEGEEGCFAEM